MTGSPTKTLTSTLERSIFRRLKPRNFQQMFIGSSCMEAQTHNELELKMLYQTYNHRTPAAVSVHSRHPVTPGWDGMVPSAAG